MFLFFHQNLSLFLDQFSLLIRQRSKLEARDSRATMGFSAFLISITDTDVRADRLPRLRSRIAARAHALHLTPA
jgi:hypothetical protein